MGSSSMRAKRIRFAPVVVVAGVACAAVLGFSTNGTFAAFAATITNSTNTGATGTLMMQEQNAGATVTCTSTDGTGNNVSTNSATCSSINKFGGSTTMYPGQPVVTTISIKNTGTVAAQGFTLAPGASCTQGTNGGTNGNATDLCAKMNLTITSGGATVYTGTLAGFAGSASSAMTMPAAPAAGATVSFTFTVTLASTAGNGYQGLSASVPMTWQFSA